MIHKAPWPESAAEPSSRVWGLGIWVGGLGFRVWGLGIRVGGLGFGVQGFSRLEAKGLRFRVGGFRYSDV